MTLELLYLLFLILVACLIAYFDVGRPLIRSTPLFLLMAIFFVIVRYSGPDHDISTYNEMMLSTTTSLYFFKEPVFWLGSRYLYLLIDSHEIVFLIFDILAISAVFKAVKNFELPKYFTILWFIFFAVFMGYENVYRQFLSVCFFFLSLSYLYKSSYKKAVFIFLISILTHNVAALFLPVVFILGDFKISRLYQNLMFLFSSISIFLLLPLVVGSKSNNETGEYGVLIYILSMLMIFFYLLLINNFRFTGKDKDFFILQIYNFILLCISVLIMGQAQSKRVGMFALCISLFCLLQLGERKLGKYRWLFILKVLIISLPTLLFPSSFEMLQTSLNQ